MNRHSHMVNLNMVFLKIDNRKIFQYSAVTCTLKILKAVAFNESEHFIRLKGTTIS
jgi:hypothetical protein